MRARLEGSELRAGLHRQRREVHRLRGGPVERIDGYTDLFGAQAVSLDPDGFSVWQRRTELGLQLLSALDRLIGCIAEPV